MAPIKLWRMFHAMFSRDQRVDAVIFNYFRPVVTNKMVEKIILMLWQVGWGGRGQPQSIGWQLCQLCCLKLVCIFQTQTMCFYALCRRNIFRVERLICPRYWTNKDISEGWSIPGKCLTGLLSNCPFLKLLIRLPLSLTAGCWQCWPLLGCQSVNLEAS